jgi:hypothetical protein
LRECCVGDGVLKEFLAFPVTAERGCDRSAEATAQADCGSGFSQGAAGEDGVCDGDSASCDTCDGSDADPPPTPSWLGHSSLDFVDLRPELLPVETGLLGREARVAK